uniref:Uncharacterized protein n=1 Tax=Anguilla anguilla TaxID=7936 RepID=A0A0E9V6T7_ANGAN
MKPSRLSPSPSASGAHRDHLRFTPLA